jgi:hemerythrin superfamily protein
MNIKDTVSKIFGGESGDGPAPDALTLMRTDHREVDALFAEALGEKTPAAKRRATVAKIVDALTVHAEMEEAIFYPALRKAGGKDERDSVLEAAEEHGMVKDMIEKIKGVQGRDETLEAKVTVLKELVQHHVREEESTIFDEAKKALGDDRLQKLGAEMQRFKKRAKGGGRSGSGGGKTAAKKAAERGTPSAAPRGAKKTVAKKAGAKKTSASRNGSARKKR